MMLAESSIFGVVATSAEEATGSVELTATSARSWYNECILRVGWLSGRGRDPCVLMSWLEGEMESDRASTLARRKAHSTGHERDSTGRWPYLRVVGSRTHVLFLLICQRLMYLLTGRQYHSEL